MSNGKENSWSKTVEQAIELLEASDEFGIMQYPNPQCVYYVSCFNRYCGVCGISIPLPLTLQMLRKRENEIIDETNEHEYQKKIVGNIFCIRCGKKL